MATVTSRENTLLKKEKLRNTFFESKLLLEIQPAISLKSEYGHCLFRILHNIQVF